MACCPLFNRDGYPRILLPSNAIALTEEPVNGEYLSLTNRIASTPPQNEVQPLQSFWARELARAGSV